ncbi:hypothetical protein SISSUDRAFT_1038012, partial [Sistotremastrum suecicum HHB10207 ss-3]
DPLGLTAKKIQLFELMIALKERGLVIVNWPLGIRQFSALHLNSFQIPGGQLQLLLLSKEHQPGYICYITSYNEVPSLREIVREEFNDHTDRQQEPRVVTDSKCPCQLAACSPIQLSRFVRGDEVVFENASANPPTVGKRSQDVLDNPPPLVNKRHRTSAQDPLAGALTPRVPAAMESATEALSDDSDDLYVQVPIRRKAIPRDEVQGLAPDNAQPTTGVSAPDNSQGIARPSAISSPAAVLLPQPTGVPIDNNDNSLTGHLVCVLNMVWISQTLVTRGGWDMDYSNGLIEQLFDKFIPQHPPFPPASEKEWSSVFEAAQAAGINGDWLKIRLKAWITEIQNQEIISISEVILISQAFGSLLTVANVIMQGEALVNMQTTVLKWWLGMISLTSSDADFGRACRILWGAHSRNTVSDEDRDEIIKVPVQHSEPRVPNYLSNLISQLCVQWYQNNCSPITSESTKISFIFQASRRTEAERAMGATGVQPRGTKVHSWALNLAKNTTLVRRVQNAAAADASDVEDCGAGTRRLTDLEERSEKPVPIESLFR